MQRTFYMIILNTYNYLDECIDVTRVKRITNIILKNYVLQKHYLGKSFTKEYVARMKTKNKVVVVLETITMTVFDSPNYSKHT